MVNYKICVPVCAYKSTKKYWIQGLESLDNMGLKRNNDRQVTFNFSNEFKQTKKIEKFRFQEHFLSVLKFDYF